MIVAVVFVIYVVSLRGRLVEVFVVLFCIFVVFFWDFWLLVLVVIICFIAVWDVDFWGVRISWGVVMGIGKFISILGGSDIIWLGVNRISFFVIKW